MHITILSLKRAAKPLQTFFVCAFAAYILSACAVSENPQTEELVKTGIPTFSGLTTVSLTTPTVAFTLNGECDPISKGLEWSFDQTTWTTISAGCVNSAFSISFLVTKVRTVYVRAKTKLGQTESGVATVRFVMPPTAPSFQVVSAGSQAEIGDVAIPFTASGTVSGSPGLSAAHKLDTNITGMVYGF